MKNEFCTLSEEQIEKVPDRFKGFLRSPFYQERGFVQVPEDTFKDMIDLIVELALKEKFETKDEKQN